MRKMRSFLLILFLFSVSLYASSKKSATVEELKQRVSKGLPELEGWCSKEKAMNFIDLILEVKPEVYVEIGVFGGSSLFPVASALKFLNKGIVIGIDPWDKLECIKNFDPLEDKEHLEWWGRVNLDLVYISYLNTLKRYGLVDYCLTLKTSSENAASEIEVIDILYIDGNHSEESFIQDVLLYLPKVRSNGYIWLNDALWAGAQPAVNILSESCTVMKVIDNGNCILFKKGQ